LSDGECGWLRECFDHPLTYSKICHRGASRKRRWIREESKDEVYSPECVKVDKFSEVEGNSV
jgi:hypothetical protein